MHRLAWLSVAVLLSSTILGAQTAAQSAASPKDALGRDNPRGTLLGFMTAARNGTEGVAVNYLETNLQGAAAAELVRKLFVVLDARLPARVTEVSDRPEGSLANPLTPDRDLVGTIATTNGSLDLMVRRMTRASIPVWVFSRETLQAIPEVFDEINVVSIDRFLPEPLKLRFGPIRLFEWLALLVVVPVFYRLTGMLGQLLGAVVAFIRRRRSRETVPHFNVLPGSVRLLLVAFAIRWLLTKLELPFFERQFWAVAAALLLAISIAWLLLMLNGFGETYLRRELRGSRFGEVTALLRFARRVADVLAILVCVLGMFRYFGVDLTPALAGLGIGGIAFALAAQKTLENVIGGISIIFDKAVRVGDFLKVGDTVGTVDFIGLRSTRIRTLDRTMVSVPNGQIASLGIETMSVRDKFWFHHFIPLRYETTSAQIRSIVDGIRDVLAQHPSVDREIWVRFFRLGPFSLDIEIFSYVYASDWNSFLETQQELLLRVVEVVERNGTAIAIPSQTLQLTDARGTIVATERTGHAQPT